ncbi:hypothetical protein V5O48_012375 [Marasmius crinis-equi]|uniref:Glycopeptide n=1 Tax=Marasmius crinis-equi TaxID=585013 RepID=A0ABR3F3D8_9AGAR
MFSTLVKFAVLAAAAGTAMAERHTITMNNHCGRGTPTLIRGGKVVATGTTTVDGVFDAAIAYLQTGNCLFNGENCMTVEITLKNPNPAAPGSGSSVNLSLIPPHAFNVPISFHYASSGCSAGNSCNNANCPPSQAFHVPTDTGSQRACQGNDANLVIDFC